MHWLYSVVIISVLHLWFGYSTISNLVPQAIALCKVVFQLLEIAIKLARQFIHWYKKNMPKVTLQDCTTQTPDCDSCVRLRHEVFELQERQQRGDFNADLQKVMHDQQVDLEASLAKLRLAEGQANQQRTEIDSPKEAQRLSRNDNTNDERIVAPQQSLEQLRQQNAQLKTAGLQQIDQTLRERGRALRAERELDLWANKIKTLSNDRNKLRQELDKVRTQLRHQERRASWQRQGRIRAVENEGLRWPGTILWQNQEVMFT